MAAARKRRKSREHVEVGAEERILEAACFEFARRGLGGTTVRQIAERAGVAHPLINYYFGDKESLWREAAARLYGRVADHIAEQERLCRELDDHARIRTLLVEFVMVAAESRLLTFLIEATHDGRERIQWLTRNFVLPVERRIRALIREGQRRGFIVGGGAPLIYRVLTGFSVAVSTDDLVQGREHTPAKLRREAEDLVAFIMRARDSE